MRFLPLKIAFFEGFENDNILSSKSYMVTKVEYLLNQSWDLYEICNLSSKGTVSKKKKKLMEFSIKGPDTASQPLNGKKNMV